MNHMLVRGLTAILVLVWGSHAVALAQEAPPPEILAYADLILHNGKVLTADDSFTVGDAVAIREGRVLAVGNSARILRMKGPRTRVMDLQGKTVTPGFIDTHFHLHNYAFNVNINGGIHIHPVVNAAELEGDETHEGFLRVLRQKARQAQPRDGWIVYTDSPAHGLLEDKLIPSLTQADLDEVFPAGQPAAVGASHGNNYTAYVVNSAGMKIVLQKIPPDTFGIFKDPKTGQPTGVLIADAASLFGRAVLPWPDMKLVMQCLEKVIPMYTAQGLTMIQTKTPGYVMAALREYWRRGTQPIRWRANIDFGPDAEAWVKILGNLTDVGDPWLRITSGPGEVPRPYWDSLYEPPKQGRDALGRPTSGRLNQSPEIRQKMLQEMEEKGVRTDAFVAAKYGWSITNTHNNGDLSTDAFLTEIEKGLKERVIEAYGQRFGTDHSLMLTPRTPQGNQFERMKNVGIVPSLNAGQLLGPEGTAYEEAAADGTPATRVEVLSMVWGKDRVARMLPAKSLIRAGLKPTSESDSAIYPKSYPLWLLEKLVTRKDDKLGIVWGPNERVTRQEALWMKTNWAAAYTADQKDLGSLEPGKQADLVVLDKDYMTVPEDDISEIKVLMTLIGGKLIYDASRDNIPIPGR